MDVCLSRGRKTEVTTSAKRLYDGLSYVTSHRGVLALQHIAGSKPALDDYFSDWSRAVHKNV